MKVWKVFDSNIYNYSKLFIVVLSAKKISNSKKILSNLFENFESIIILKIHYLLIIKIGLRYFQMYLSTFWIIKNYTQILF